MGIDIGRLGRCYLGIEVSPGTAVAATVLLPLSSPAKVQDKHEPIPVDTGSGRRYVTQDSVMGKRWSEGEVPMYLDSVNAGYLLKLALGNEVNTSIAAGVNDHNFYPTVSGNTPLTATIYNCRAATTDVERIDSAVVNTFALSFEDGLVECTASVLGRFPQLGAAEPTVVVASGTTFSFRDAQIYFGATMAAAEGGSATPVTQFSCEVAQDVEMIYRSNEGDVLTLRTKGFKVTGKYTVFFDSVTERDKYRELTKKAIVAKFTGITIATGYQEFTKLRFAKVRLDEGEIDTGLDDFFVFAGSFTAEVDNAQVPNAFDVVVRNNKSSVY